MQLKYEQKDIYQGFQRSSHGKALHYYFNKNIDNVSWSMAEYSI